MEEKRYTTGDVASAAGLTVRTVQYYDNIGLLRSPGRTEGGRRYYTDDDLIRLEQIVLYKSLGFSLEQIKKQLLFQPDQTQLLGMLTSQRLLLLQRMEHLHTSFVALGVMADMVEEGRDISFALLLRIVSALPDDDLFSQAPQMLTDEQKGMFSEQQQNLESVKQFYHRNKEILIEAMMLVHEETSPESPEAQALAGRWWKEIVSYTNGDMELVRALSQLNLDERLVVKNAELLASAKRFMESAFATFAAENDLASSLGIENGVG